MTRPHVYDSYLVQTRRGAAFLLAVFIVVIANVIVLKYFRNIRLYGTWSPLAVVRAVGIGVWLSAPAALTIRILRYLERLEKQRDQPDETMNFLFSVAQFVPILGYLPFLLTF